MRARNIERNRKVIQTIHIKKNIYYFTIKVNICYNIKWYNNKNELHYAFIRALHTTNVTFYKLFCI